MLHVNSVLIKLGEKRNAGTGKRIKSITRTWKAKHEEKEGTKNVTWN